MNRIVVSVGPHFDDLIAAKVYRADKPVVMLRSADTRNLNLEDGKKAVLKVSQDGHDVFLTNNGPKPLVCVTTLPNGDILDDAPRRGETLAFTGKGTICSFHT